MDGETSLYLVTENGLLNVTTKMEHIKIKKVEKEWSLSAIFYGGNQVDLINISITNTVC